MQTPPEPYIPSSDSVYAFSDNIYRLAYLYTKNRPDAEDITQDAFLRLFSEKRVFESDEHCKNWLLKTAYNCTMTLLKKRSRRGTASIDDCPEPEYNDSYDDGCVSAAVAALSEPQRICIHLFYYEDKSLDDICRITGFRLNTVKSHLNRARQVLKTSLKGIYDDI